MSISHASTTLSLRPISIFTFFVLMLVALLTAPTHTRAHTETRASPIVQSPFDCMTLSFNAPINYAVPAAPGQPFPLFPLNDATSGDFNQDHIPDLAIVGLHDSFPISILLGNGDGTFQRFADYPSGGSNRVIHVADFNEDGHADLAAAGGPARLFFGNGDGTFLSGATLSMNGQFLAVGDFNGDGHHDLVGSASGGDGLGLALGNGDGSFRAEVFYNNGLHHRDVAVGDFNNDGKEDLVTANLTSDNVSVLLGNGDGTFLTAVNYPGPIHAWTVEVADLNGDQNQDLAIGGFGVFIMLGNGDGTFGAAISYPGELLQTAIGISDLNGDGNRDLSVGCLSCSSASMLGNGDGTFQELTSLNTFAFQMGIVANTDLNNDGRFDLAVPSSEGLQVLINSSGCTPANNSPNSKDGSIALTGPDPILMKLQAKDADNDFLSFNVGATPAHGTLEFLGTVSCYSATSVANCSTTVRYTPNPPFNQPDSFTFTVEDGKSGTSVGTIAITGPPLIAIGPAQIWIGLKNSDDVGTKFDLLAEVFKNGLPVGSGQLNNVSGGSSGFNNANLQVINLALSTSTDLSSGDTFSIKLSVRISASSGHNSGTARLWFNDSSANSRFSATIGSSSSTYYLRTLPSLSTTIGSGPRKTVDVQVNRNVGGNAFKPFGTWSTTL